MAEGAIATLPDEQDLGEFGSLPEASNSSLPKDADLGEFAALPDISPTPASDREAGHPDLGAFGDLPDKDLGEFSALPDAPKPIGSATKTALDATPDVPVFNPRQEEIRAPEARDIPRRILRSIEHYSEIPFTPAQPTPGGIMSPEVAAVPVKFFSGGSRTAAKLISKLTGNEKYKEAEAGAEEALAQSLSDFTNPEGIAGLLQFAVPGVAEVYAVNVLSKLPDQYGHLKDTIEQHGLISKEAAVAATQAGIQDLFGFLAGHSAKLVKLNRPAPKGGATDLMRKRLSGEELIRADAEHGEQIAQDLGLDFKGIQPTPEGYKNLLLFEDKVSGGAAVTEGSTVAEFKAHLEEKRAGFEREGGEQDAIQEPIATSEVLRASETGKDVAGDTGRVGEKDAGEVTGATAQEETGAAPSAEVKVSQPAEEQGVKTETPPAAEAPSAEPVPEFAPKSDKPTIIKVQGQTFEGKTEAEAYEKAREKLAPYVPPDEFEAMLRKEPDFEIDDAPTPDSAKDFKARKQAEASQMAEYLQHERRKGDELFKSISLRGGLPTKSSPHWEAELEGLWENPKARRLFRKTAKPLDRLREGLEEAGFEFSVPDDMIKAIEERARTGKMMFAERSNVPGEDIFGFGPGAAAAAEVGMGRKPVTMRNAEIDARRAAEGRDPIFSSGRLSNALLWDQAMARIDRNPNAPAILVDRINAGEIEAASPIEQMMLLHEELRLQNEKTIESVRARDDSLGEDLQAEHRANVAAADMRLDATEKANNLFGTIEGRALQARKTAAFDDFTLAVMETRARNAKGGPLSEAESIKIAEQAAEIERLKEEIANKPDVDALAVMKSLLDEQLKVTKAAAKSGKGFVETLHSARDAALKRSAERRRQGRLYSGVDPEALLDAVIIGASHIADGLRDFGKWGAAMVRDLGEGVREHLKDLFDRSQQYHDANEKAAKPKADREKVSPIEAISKASEEAKPLTQKMVFDLAREHINDGLVEGMEPNAALDTLMKAVKDDVSEHFPDITEREIRDTFTEYGKQRIPSKAEDLKQLRELRRLGQLRSSIEDVLGGERPRKTGMVRDKPSQAVREKMKELNDAMRDAGFESTGPEQLASRNQARETSLRNQIEDIEKELATGERRKPGAPVPDTEAVKILRIRRDALKKELDAARKADPSFEAADQRARLARYKTFLDRRIKDVQERIKKGDYTKPPKKETVLDKEAKAKQFQLAQLKQEFNRGVLDLKLKNRTGVEKFLGGGRQVLNTSRAIITSADLSAVLRQGGFIALGHPIRAAQGFGPMLRAFRSERGRFEINEAIRNDPDYAFSQQAKLYIHDERDLALEKMEEAYMSRWAGKIPIVAGSERAYTTFLNKLRMDSFKALIRTLGRDHEVTLKEAKAIANYVNVATGRGNLDGIAKAADNLNTIFFAPRYVASRFQLMLGEPLYGGTSATRKLIAIEYARALTGLALIYALGKMAGGTLESDSRSSDFGKIRFGNTRLDPMMGLAQTSVVVSRVVQGETKQASGQIVPIRGKGVKYGGTKTQDVMSRFVRSKLSPAFGAIVNVSAGEDVVGNPVTPLSELRRNITPLAVSDVVQAMEDQGIARGTALGMLAILGMGLQTYTPRNKDYIPSGTSASDKSLRYEPTP